MAELAVFLIFVLYLGSVSRRGPFRSVAFVVRADGPHPSAMPQFQGVGAGDDDSADGGGALGDCVLCMVRRAVCLTRCSPGDDEPTRLHQLLLRPRSWPGCA